MNNGLIRTLLVGLNITTLEWHQGATSQIYYIELGLTNISWDETEHHRITYLSLLRVWMHHVII